jgi:glucose-6-phosphate isomerase
MLPKVNPLSTSAWARLTAHLNEMRHVQMRDLFSDDENRTGKFSIKNETAVFDYSRNLVNDTTIKLLLGLAEECRLEQAMTAMFNGDLINETENRAVLHTALRNKTDETVNTGGKDIKPLVMAELERIKQFCNAVHKGKFRGYSGKRFRYIVNIGIGGSDLGPQMVTEALKSSWVKNIRPYFISNIDPSNVTDVLNEIDPERTLFLIASKTFTTQETMTNAETVRSWFLKKAKNKKHISTHFVALSTNEKAVKDFGIATEFTFRFWDWVGGRFSLWCAAGLTIPLVIGYKQFEELLKGAEAADHHFKTASWEKNIPVLMAMLGIWYINFFNCQTQAIIPYDHYLRFFPDYLQQAVMESNGKSVDRNGQKVDYATGPIIWGAPGTNGQHAFFQLLHQGTQLVPVDFIGCLKPHYNISDHHKKLLANFYAQPQALMVGKTATEAENEMKKQGLSKEEIKSLLPYKVFTGNKPSNSIILNELTPFSLGQLIAWYEHKIFVQGIIWNIYSFDQWGVELGKQLAGKILSENSPA